jgi:hypothetical protein
MLFSQHTECLVGGKITDIQINGEDVNTHRILQEPQSVGSIATEQTSEVSYIDIRKWKELLWKFEVRPEPLGYSPP